MLHALGGRLVWHVRLGPVSDCDHSQRLLSHRSIGTQDSLPACRVKRQRLILDGLVMSAQFEHHIGCSLGRGHFPPAQAPVVEGTRIFGGGIEDFVDGGHPFAAGVEGDLVDARVDLL